MRLRRACFCRIIAGPRTPSSSCSKPLKIMTIRSLTFATASSRVSPDELMFASNSVATKPPSSGCTTTLKSLITSKGSGANVAIGTHTDSRHASPQSPSMRVIRAERPSSSFSTSSTRVESVEELIGIAPTSAPDDGCRHVAPRREKCANLPGYSRPCERANQPVTRPVRERRWSGPAARSRSGGYPGLRAGGLPARSRSGTTFVG